MDLLNMSDQELEDRLIEIRKKLTEMRQETLLLKREQAILANEKMWRKEYGDLNDHFLKAFEIAEEEQNFTVSNIADILVALVDDIEMKESLTPRKVGYLLRKFGYVVVKSTRGETKGRYEVVV